MKILDTPPLNIRILGRFQLTYDNRLISTLNRPRLQALLAYLLLHRGEPTSRQRLAFLFWPDASEKQAYTNLRNLMYKLRQFLPQADRYLHLSREMVQWLEDTPYSLDVAHFESGLSTAQRARQTNNLTLEQASLAQAVDSYGGELLPDLYDDWVLAERERLNKLFMDALVRLTALMEDQRDYTTALAFAQRLRQHDPLREETYRVLMRLHALNDDRTAALRAYHDCVTVLEEELAAEPSLKTQRAYSRILELSRQPSEAIGRVQALVGHTPLVGRQTEWSAVTAAWQRARRGQPHLLLIAGEAGIGKTRLAEELLEKAVRQGITAVSARAYEAEGDMAYAPIAEWLRSQVFDGALKQLDEVWLREVARLLPQMLATQPGLEPPGPLTERWQQLRFFEALARVVLTGTQPLILHLDDLQWCDSETLAWLGYLLRYDPSAKLLVVGTVRTEEIDKDHPLTPWRLTMRQIGVITEIALDPLNAVDAKTLAGHVAGQELNSAQAEILYTETEGNPLFVVETTRAQLNTTTPQRTPARSSRSLPSRMHAVLEARLMQLTPGARELAGVAAVIGREFNFPVLAAASGSDEKELILKLEELWQRRIVRDRGADAYDFSHDKLREVTYGALSTVRRRMLHRKVAEALEVVHTDQLDEISGELGIHFEVAGDSMQACNNLRRAGGYAAARYANADAITYFSRALDLTSPDDLETCFDLLRERELVYAMSGVSDGRRADLEQMAQLAHGLADDRRSAQAALRQANFCHQNGEFVTGANFAKSAIAFAQAAEDLELQATSLYFYARIRRNLVSLDEARQEHEQALVSAQQAGDKSLEALCQGYLAALLVYSGLMTAAQFHGQKALELVQSDQDEGERILPLMVNAIVERGAGNPYVARTHLLDSQHIAHRIGHKRMEALLVGNLGGCHNLLGDFDGALALLDQAALLADETGFHIAQITFMQYKAETFYQLGRSEEGLDLALRCLSFVQAGDDRREEAIALLIIGMLQCGQGQTAESVKSFGRAREIAQDLGDRLTELEALAGLTQAHFEAGEIGEAMASVEQILPHILEGPTTHTETFAPMTLFLACHETLTATDDPRALECLQFGYREVQMVAARIPEPALRRSFLENIGEVRAIVAAAKRENWIEA